MTAPVEDPPFDPDYDRPPTPRPHTPQHNPEAEQAILGALILNPATIDTLAGELQPGDFYQPRHETIWNAAHHLHHNPGTTLDLLTLAEHLRQTGELQRIGGPTYLHDLMEACPLAANATYYARIVRNAARLRKVDEVATRLHEVARKADPTSIDQALADSLDILDTATARFGPTTGPITPTTWAPVDLELVLAGEYLDPPPTMLHRTDGVPLLYDGAVHTISGESESGKTWLTLLAALQLLEAGDNVVFIDFEDRADRVIARLMALGATPQQIRDHFAYIRPDRPLDDDGRAQLTPHLTDTHLAIIDGVTEAMTIHGYDLNSNADSALFQALLPRWIADHGPAVVLIDHVVKDHEKQGRFALGAQHKLAGIDGVAYLVKMLQPFARGKRGIARIDIAKDRPGHVRGYAHGKTIAEFTLDATSGNDAILTAHLTPPGHDTGRAGDTFEPTIFMERISRFVQLNPGLSKKAIEDTINGRASTKRLALELLVTRGYIGTKNGTRGAVQHYHQKPYYADPDHDPDSPQNDDTDITEEAS